MKKIIISVDHKWRDLPSNVLLKKFLEHYGHEVHIIRAGFEEPFVIGTKADMVIMIHLLDVNHQELAKRLQKAGVHVVLMPTEGIPTLDFYRKFASGAFNDLSGVSLQFVWNNEVKNLLVTNKTISEDKIKVVGCPRFDFYRLPLLNHLMNKDSFCKQYNLDPSLKIVTFATNFTQAQFFSKNSQFLIDDANRLGYGDVLSQSSISLYEMSKRDSDSRDILFDAFIRLVEDTKDVNFLLKLHPSEDHQYYINKLENAYFHLKKRITIIANQYIWDVIFVTDVLIKRSCTTGVEAWMLNKPTIELSLNSDEWYFSEEHASGSYIARNYSDLKKHIDFYLQGGSVSVTLNLNRQKFIDKWCYSVDGYRTLNYAAEVTKLLKENSPQKNIKFNLRKWIIYASLRYSRYLVHDLKIYELKSYLSGKKIDKLGRLDKYISIRDVNYWEGLFDKMNVLKIFDLV
jgi:surface carbohydrate biosynthesis protein